MKGGIRLTIESAGSTTSSFSSTTITSNRFVNNGDVASGTAIWSRTGDSGITATNTIWSRGITIANNYITGQGTVSGSVAPINCGGCDGAKIYNNVMDDNWVAGGQIELLKSINLDVYNNWINRTKSTNGIDGSGIFIDAFTDSSVVRGNFIRNCDNSLPAVNSGQGIAIFKARSNSIFGNIIAGCKIGIAYSGDRTELNKVYNNTVYNTLRSGIGRGSDSSVPDNVATALDVRNNIIAFSPACYMGFSTPLASSDYNACYEAPYSTTTQAQGAHDITSNPKFVSSSATSSLDFKLSPNSPAINAGTRVGQFVDYFGRLYNYKPSIGAFEQGARDFVDYFGKSFMSNYRGL